MCRQISNTLKQKLFMSFCCCVIFIFPLILLLSIPPANLQTMDDPTTMNSSEDYATTTSDTPSATNDTVPEWMKILEEMGPDVREVLLMDRNVSFIDSDTFISKKKLRVLILRDNPLEIAPDRPWLRHPTLGCIDIADCNLGPLEPVVFSLLPRLKSVNMAGNAGCDETEQRARASDNATFEVFCDHSMSLVKLGDELHVDDVCYF